MEETCLIDSCQTTDTKGALRLLLGNRSQGFICKECLKAHNGLKLHLIVDPEKVQVQGIIPIANPFTE